MASVEAVMEERAARSQVRHMERMRAGRQRQLERERRERARMQRRREAWTEAEREAYSAWVASGETEAQRDPKLKRKWLTVWANDPVMA